MCTVPSVLAVAILGCRPVYVISKFEDNEECITVIKMQHVQVEFNTVPKLIYLYFVYNFCDCVVLPFLVFMSNYRNTLWSVLYGRVSVVEPDPDPHCSALIWLYWISIGNVNPDSNSGSRKLTKINK
jgi:hypothetical protein